MNRLIQQIRDRYEQEITLPASREDVESYVRRAFDERNIRPTPELVQRVVDYLIDGTPVGPLQGYNISHCGS